MTTESDSAESECCGGHPQPVSGRSKGMFSTAGLPCQHSGSQQTVKQLHTDGVNRFGNRDHILPFEPVAGFEQASDGSKQMTEIMPHPASGDADDREAYASSVPQMMLQPSASLVGGADFDPEAEVLDHGTTREVGVQVRCGLRLSTYCRDPAVLLH